MRKEEADALATLFAVRAISHENTYLLSFKGDGSGTANARELADFIKALSERFVHDLHDNVSANALLTPPK